MAGIAFSVSKRGTQKSNQYIKTKYNQEENDTEFGDLIELLELVNKKVDKDLLLLSLPAINKSLGKLLEKIGRLFAACSLKCKSQMKKIKDTEILNDLKELESKNKYAYAQVCKTQSEECIQFMTLCSLFEKPLYYANKQAISSGNRTPRTRKSASGNSRGRSISPNSSAEIQKFKKQYAEFLKMISRPEMNGGQRRTKKKYGNR
jgi:hypothetical protein